MRRIALAALVLAGCGSSPSPPLRASPSPPPAIAPAPRSPPPIAIYPGPISVPPAPIGQPDQCGAWELQRLLGRPRTEIPVPVEPRRRRVICTTCPRTMDFSPNRLTIEYDAETNLVTKVGCG